MEALSFLRLEPALHGLALVETVVIQDETNLQIRRDLLLQFFLKNSRISGSDVGTGQSAAMRILVVEDDASRASFLKKGLKRSTM
jgi:hypothetical protein